LPSPAGDYRSLSFQFPESTEDGIQARGGVKTSFRDDQQSDHRRIYRSDMIAIVLGISICAVYSIDCYLGPIDQAEAYCSVAGSD
jgi:hypothetical protein